MKLSKGKQQLLNYLGQPYCIKQIDLEDCVYLDMGEYDIEISGGRTTYSKVDIYVWRTKDRLEIVERHQDLKYDLPSIKAILDDIRTRYSLQGVKEIVGEEVSYGL
ncbi:MAG: hypothetical protein LRY71_08320 [Bacillaceae bacterium]|nr:hypothetical protein [Bacillaceae bacterium]